jgi:hypothetical protein
MKTREYASAGLLLAFSLAGLTHAENPPTRREINLDGPWRVTQDVHDVGEKVQWFNPDTRDARVGQPLSDGWQTIPRLAHLQLLLAAQPYFGRELRSFNVPRGGIASISPPPPAPAPPLCALQASTTIAPSG